MKMDKIKMEGRNVTRDYIYAVFDLNGKLISPIYRCELRKGFNPDIFCSIVVREKDWNPDKVGIITAIFTDPEYAKEQSMTNDLNNEPFYSVTKDYLQDIFNGFQEDQREPYELEVPIGKVLKILQSR